MVAGRLPLVASFATLTSYAQPMSTSITASNTGFSAEASANIARNKDGSLELGSLQDGPADSTSGLRDMARSSMDLMSAGAATDEAVLTLHGYDPALPIAFSVQGSLQRVISHLYLVGDTVMARFVDPLPTVTKSTTYVGSLTVTVGNGWNTDTFPAQITVLPVPAPQGVTGTVAGDRGTFGGSVGGTVTGSVYQTPVTEPDSTSAYTLTAPVKGIFTVPVELAGSGAGRYWLKGIVRGTVTGEVPAAEVRSGGTVALSGSVTGSVYGSVYDQTTGLTSYLLGGTVTGQAGGSFAWVPGSGIPGPFSGSFTGTVTGSVYAPAGSTQTVAGSVYAPNDQTVTDPMITGNG